MAEITVKWADLENAAQQRKELRELHYKNVLETTIEETNKVLERWKNDILDGRATLEPNDDYTIDVPKGVDNIRLIQDLNKLLTANGFFAWQKNGSCFLQKYEKK